MSIQKTKSLLSSENIWHFHHPRLSSKIIIHPSSEEGMKSFVSSSFKETEGVRAKLNLLKMLLVVVSNHESIRRNNRWKKKKGGREIGRFHKGAKRFEGVGRGRSKILVEFLSRKRNWTASLCRNWERVQAFQAFSGWKKTGFVPLGFWVEQDFESLLRSIHWICTRIVLVILVDWWYFNKEE